MTVLKKTGFTVSLLTTLVTLFAVVLTGCGGTSNTTHAPVTINLAAAASLQGVMTELDALYVQQNPYVKIVPSFAASGTLQTQIEQGAPVDIFMSAGASQMDALQNESLIINESRENLLRNILVLMVPNDSTLGLTSFTDLTGANVERIAIGDPAVAPCGKYAKMALNDSFGIWSQLNSSSKFVLCADATTIVTYVQTDAVDAGIAYLTDTYNRSNVKIVAQGPASVNAKIIYPVAVINGSKNVADVEKFEDFLSSNQSKAVFEKYGFTMY